MLSVSFIAEEITASLFCAKIERNNLIISLIIIKADLYNIGRYLMEWVERLNQSMNYIEEHLTGEIDYEQLGRIACCSTYHYQRMFTYMAGITLAEYVRRRKLSLAAVDLQGEINGLLILQRSMATVLRLHLIERFNLFMG